MDPKSTQNTMQYPRLVQIHAEQYGNKAANLIFLKDLLNEFQSSWNSSEISVSVPDFFVLSHQQILNHLKEHIPNLEDCWTQFREAQGNHSSLTKPAQTILADLRQKITNCFIEHPIPLQLAQFPHDCEFFMVRSTGDEDQVTSANPGGNESLASRSDSLSHAIGVVIASYMSEKSLSQRLSLNENITDHFPLAPCLIQRLIQSEHVDSPVISGVCYSNSQYDKTQINAAQGHGELIVDSLGAFDSYTVIRNRIYAQVRDKKNRIEKKLDQNSGKLCSVLLDNNVRQQHSSCLREEELNLIHTVALFIEQKYGMRMDLEFAYHPKEKKLSILQGRALAAPELMPYALDHDFILKNQPQYLPVRVITKNNHTALVINNINQLMIDQDIESALRKFLQTLSSDKQTRMVLVKEPTPDTSHGACFFQSNGILTLEIQNDSATLDDVVHTMRDYLMKGYVLVPDPQHRKIFYIPADQFDPDRCMTRQLVGSTEDLSMTLLQPRALSREKILSNLKEIFNQMQVIQHGEIPHVRLTMKEIRESLDQISIPPVTQDNQKVIANDRRILVKLVRFIISLHLKNIVSLELMNEISLVAAELHSLLTEFEENPKNAVALQQYLDIFNKFEGLFLSQPEPGMHVDSMMVAFLHQKQKSSAQKVHDQQLQQRRVHPNTLTTLWNEFLHNMNLKKNPRLFEKSALTEQQKMFFSLTTALGQYFFQESAKEAWYDFCFSCCFQDQGLKLTILCNALMKMEIAEIFLNTVFPALYPNDHATDALSRLYQMIYQDHKEQRHAMQKSDAIINKLTAQIQQWSIPSEFPNLYKELSQELKILKDQLGLVDSHTVQKYTSHPTIAALWYQKVYKIVDLIDLSLKELQSSNLYDDPRVQAQNFHTLLSDFYQILQILLIHPESKTSQMNKIALLMNQHQSTLRNLEESQIFQISDEVEGVIYDAQKALLLSKDFSVVAATLYRAGDCMEQSFVFDEVVTTRSTLADLHTLIHQTILDSLSIHLQNSQKDFIQSLPDELRTIMRAIEENQTLSFGEKPPQPQLFAVSMKHPTITVKYNLPLRYHSGVLTCHYSLASQETEFCFQLYGNDSVRWARLTHYGEMLLENTLPSNVSLNAYHEYNLMTIKVRLKETKDIQNALKIFNTLSHSTLVKTDFDRLFETKPNLSPLHLPQEDQDYLFALFKNHKISYRDLNSPRTLRRVFLIKKSAVADLAEQFTSSQVRTIQKYRKILHAKEAVFKVFVMNQEISLAETLDIQFSDLESIIDENLAQLLTSPQAQNFYKKHGGSFFKATHYDFELLKLICSEEGLSQIFNPELIQYLPPIYRNNILDFIERSGFSVSMLRLMFSSQAIQAYQSGEISIAIIKELSSLIGSYHLTTIFPVLISPQAITTYQYAKDNHINLSCKMIAQIRSPEIATIAISNDALEYYKSGRLNVDFFIRYREQPLDYFKFLLSHQALFFYEKGIPPEKIISFKTIEMLDFLRRLSSGLKLSFIQNDINMFLDFLTRNPLLEELLVSQIAISAYRKGFDYHLFDRMSVKKADLLLSQELVELWVNHRDRFNELSQSEDFELLEFLKLRSNLRHQYENGALLKQIKFFQLSQKYPHFRNFNCDLTTHSLESTFQNYLAPLLKRDPDSVLSTLSQLNELMKEFFKATGTRLNFHGESYQKIFLSSLAQSSSFLEKVIRYGNEYSLYQNITDLQVVNQIASICLKNHASVFLFQSCRLPDLVSNPLSYLLELPGLNAYDIVISIKSLIDCYQYQLSPSEEHQFSLWLHEVIDGQTRLQRIESLCQYYEDSFTMSFCKKYQSKITQTLDHRVFQQEEQKNPVVVASLYVNATQNHSEQVLSSPKIEKK